MLRKPVDWRPGHRQQSIDYARRGRFQSASGRGFDSHRLQFLGQYSSVTKSINFDFGGNLTGKSNLQAIDALNSAGDRLKLLLEIAYAALDPFRRK